MDPRLPRLTLCLTMLALASCAIVSPPPATPEETLARTPVSDSNAVIALAESARADTDGGNFIKAAAALERALRIEPRNPRLWHELAQLKLKEGDYAQATNMAARSNTWAGTDKMLRAANWRVIGEAKRSTGDDAGARAAFDKADALTR
jgi:tetratricopeptide (TPR) repeat protein